MISRRKCSLSLRSAGLVCGGELRPRELAVAEAEAEAEAESQRLSLAT